MTRSILALMLVGASALAEEEAGTTVVLVHGAFADGSSWDKVIPLLQAKGLPVVAVQTKVMAVTQGPSFGKSFDEKVANAAWKAKPSWYIVAEKDRMIQPDVERAMAKKINAKVTSLPTSHVVMLSHPKDVAAVILAAAGKSISKVAVSAAKE